MRITDLAARMFALALLSAACGGAALALDVPLARYAVDPTWPQRPADLAADATPGVAIDKDDNIYISSRSQPAVQVYRPDGKFVRAFRVENFGRPHFIRIAPDGNLWLADNGSHVVQKYSPQGKLLLSLGVKDQPGADAAHFDKPTDVAQLPGGEFFVSDGYGNRRVLHFDRDGKFIKQWGEEGVGPGQFALVHSIVADSKNRLYVADRENARIQVFDTTGKSLAVWEGLITPWGLCMTKDDQLWVCGSTPAKKPDGKGFVVQPPTDQFLLKLDTSGKPQLKAPLTLSASTPGQAGEVNWVHGLAIDSKGDFYLGDIQGKRIQKFVRPSRHSQ